MVVSTKIAYIYGLSSSSNNLVRYIGYSEAPKKRFTTHLSESKKLLYRRHKWIQSELSKGYFINMEILRCVSLEQVSKSEIETILLYKSFGADLVNGNNGGIGGISPTKETREKLKLSKLGNTYAKGTKKSEENIEAIRKRMSGRIVKQESIEKYKQTVKGRPARNRSFTEKQVIDIFKLYNKGIDVDKIAEIHNSKSKTVNNLIHTTAYNDIKLKFNLIKITRENGIKKFNTLRSKQLW